MWGFSQHYSVVDFFYHTRYNVSARILYIRSIDILMTSIIFIEGVSGVGKTTTAARLCDHLRSKGYKSACHLEGAKDNPLDPFMGSYPPSMPLSVFSETYLQCWQNFKRNRLEQDSLLVLDGTLLHHQVNDLIREYDASNKTILQHLSDLLYELQPFSPILFYLSSDNVGQSLAEARKNRKQSVATEEQIAFWNNRKRVDLSVLGRLPVESHILKIDNGWDSIIETMTECMKL